MLALFGDLEINLLQGKHRRLLGRQRELDLSRMCRQWSSNHLCSLFRRAVRRKGPIAAKGHIGRRRVRRVLRRRLKITGATVRDVAGGASTGSARTVPSAFDSAGTSAGKRDESGLAEDALSTIARGLHRRDEKFRANPTSIQPSTAGVTEKVKGARITDTLGLNIGTVHTHESCFNSSHCEASNKSALPTAWLKEETKLPEDSQARLFQSGRYSTRLFGGKDQALDRSGTSEIEQGTDEIGILDWLFAHRARDRKSWEELIGKRGTTPNFSAITGRKIPLTSSAGAVSVKSFNLSSKVPLATDKASTIKQGPVSSEPVTVMVSMSSKSNALLKHPQSSLATSRSSLKGKTTLNQSTVPALIFKNGGSENRATGVNLRGGIVAHEGRRANDDSDDDDDDDDDYDDDDADLINNNGSERHSGKRDREHFWLKDEGLRASRGLQKPSDESRREISPNSNGNRQSITAIDNGNRQTASRQPTRSSDRKSEARINIELRKLDSRVISRSAPDGLGRNELSLGSSFNGSWKHDVDSSQNNSVSRQTTVHPDSSSNTYWQPHQPSSKSSFGEILPERKIPMSGAADAPTNESQLSLPKKLDLPPRGIEESNGKVRTGDPAQTRSTLEKTTAHEITVSGEERTHEQTIEIRYKYGNDELRAHTSTTTIGPSTSTPVNSKDSGTPERPDSGETMTGQLFSDRKGHALTGQPGSDDTAETSAVFTSSSAETPRTSSAGTSRRKRIKFETTGQDTVPHVVGLTSPAANVKVKASDAFLSLKALQYGHSFKIAGLLTWRNIEQFRLQEPSSDALVDKVRRLLLRINFDGLCVDLAGVTRGNIMAYRHILRDAALEFAMEVRGPSHHRSVCWTLTPWGMEYRLLLPTEATGVGVLARFVRSAVPGSDCLCALRLNNVLQLCSVYKNTPRSYDNLTASWYLVNDTKWVAYDDYQSLRIKVPQLLEAFAPDCVYVDDVQRDDPLGVCGERPFPLVAAVHDIFAEVLRHTTRHIETPTPNPRLTGPMLV
ncbi:hypothetical protein HPB48_002535 [Haemaphysalis longicornis]|uniref:Uncharacterized protein n=1 Tax=Haemaphysalis longicornis TaxID=44386 RepID=A0A9J6GDT4_HAELO|nr:hypothetical protein HPB48_002535 [Haemaphysalis longicornis]